jgi:2-methylisocitrate lyase-like PEP mutase family enzyme
MSTSTGTADRFRSLHEGPAPLLLPNAWDQGTARLFASLGFSALATTSGGHAATLGRLDGRVTPDEAFAHAASIAEATDLPVNADLENGFADDPAGVARTVERAIEAGVAGCSIEDFARTGNEIYELALASDRVTAAVEAAHRGDVQLVLTARAENHIRGVTDLSDTIARLQAFQEAGADVLYAPGLTAIDDIRAVVGSVDRPVNVLVMPGGPTVSDLAAVGVRRISVGSAFAMVALAAVADAAREFRDEGTSGYWQQALGGMAIAHEAFAPTSPD